MLAGCTAKPPLDLGPVPPARVVTAPASPVAERLESLVVVRLDPGFIVLTPRQQGMLLHLIAAAAEMDKVFWLQSYGEPSVLLDSLTTQDERRLVTINYGPWDRFTGNQPLFDGFGTKPPGASLYPPDITRQEFEATVLPGKQDPYTVIRRHPDGGLLIVPYRHAYREQLENAALQLARAADLCDDPAFKRYLTLRARALITDDYVPSDMAWAALRNNSIDLVIGPVGHREDQLFGYKSAYAAWVLSRDPGFSQRLVGIAGLLPHVAADLPVAPAYRAGALAPVSLPGAFDALFVAGAANAGPKVSIIEMPDDPASRRSGGVRRIFLRNVMQAQFDLVVLPTAMRVMVDDQRSQVNFDAYFDNLLLAELGRGIVPAQTVTGASPRAALRERFPMIDEGLAEVLGVFIQGWLEDHGWAGSPDGTDYLVTFAATMLREIRLGNGSPGTAARAVQFNYLKAYDAITRDRATGRYRVHGGPMREALSTLAAQLLVIMGNGDYDAAGHLLQSMGEIDPVLRRDLAGLDAQVPVDMVFEQGVEVLGLE